MTGSDLQPPAAAAGRRWVPGASVAAALSLTSALLVLAGNGGLAPFLAWSGGLAITVVLARGRGARGLDRADLVALAVITVIGALFRLWRIGEIPSGPWVDELAAAANAVNLGKAGPFTPFATTPLFAIGPEWVRTSNLYLYLCRALLRLTGFSPLGVKLISLVPGIATPPLLYVLARGFLARGAAFLAGGMLAVSHWHVIDSRWGWDQVLVTALTVVMFSALLRADRVEHPPTAAVAGVFAGLAQFAYAAARLTAVAGLAFVLLQAMLGRRRRSVAAVTLFLAGFAQAVLPMAAYWARHPSTFAVRERELTIVPRLARGDVRPLAGNLQAYGGMFLVRGDANPRQNLPGKPMLDPATGALFVTGLVAATIGWRRRESQAVLLWLGVGLLGGILTDTASAPNSYRVGLVAPACALLAGIGWDGVARLARARLPVLARAVPAAAGAALALAGVLTYVDYFVIRPASRECWLSVREGAYCEMLRRSAERTLDRGGRVLLDRGLRWITTELQFDTLLRAARPGAPLDWVEARGVAPEALRHAVLIVASRNYASLPQALASTPARALTTPFGEPTFVAVSDDRALLAAAAP